MYRIDPEPRIRIAPLLRHVLIADGNAHTAGLLGAGLEAFGAGDVDIRWDWRAALACAEELSPTLIVTEAFDDADPFAVVRAIRRSDLACRETPIGVLTTLATASALKLAKDAGADEFLRKPFRAPNLVRTLDHLAVRPGRGFSPALTPDPTGDLSTPGRVADACGIGRI